MSILVGVIQGVAEFLSISSFDHLALFQMLFGIESIGKKCMSFTALLRFGALISICVVCWRGVVDMIHEFFLGIAAPAGRKDTGVVPPPARRMVIFIIITTVSLLMVVFLQGAVNRLFSNSTMVPCVLLATGFIPFFSNHTTRGHKAAKNVTVTGALIVGCGQALAVIPGLSRPGITISVDMMRGFDRAFAVRFFFLISLPAVLGANVLKTKDALASNFPIEELSTCLMGVAVSAVVRYFVIRLVKNLSDKGKFDKSVYYCWVVGLDSLVTGIVKMMLFK